MTILSGVLATVPAQQTALVVERADPTRIALITIAALAAVALLLLILVSISRKKRTE